MTPTISFYVLALFDIISLAFRSIMDTHPHSPCITYSICAHTNDIWHIRIKLRACIFNDIH